jgi:cytochrome c-type biogenesis protein CcmE
MIPRTKFLIGGVLILGAASYLMASAIRSTGVYYLTPQELAGRVAADPSFVGTGVKVGARVVPGSIAREPGGREVSFQVSDGARTFPVIYRGVIPDTFTDSADVIVDGRMGPDGTFRATTLLAKCASRYESAPDKYRTTPGYQRPAAVAARHV